MKSTFSDHNNERYRRKIYFNTLLAFITYLIPLSACFFGKLFNIAKYEYRMLHYCSGAILLSTLLFFLTIRLKKRITLRFSNIMTYMQIGGWFFIYIFWTYNLDHLRVIGLFSSLFALMFLFIFSPMWVSFSGIIIVMFSYIAITYFCIFHIGQGGVFIQEMLYVYAFTPMYFFIAFISNRVVKQAQEVKKRTSKLLQAEREIVEREHKSELADITTGTLHNVKNILSSVITSAEMAREILTGHFITGLKQANVLLRSKMDNLPEFISADPKGEKLMQYYLSLEGAFEKEANESAQQFNRLREKVAIIEKIVTAQQGYGGANIGEEVIVNRIIEDALTILLEFLESHEIKVTTKFSGTPQVIVQKTKFMHILINLLKNAKESILSEASDTQRLLISSAEIEDVVQIKISDSGCGISPENLPKLFAHGFTTKKNGHGFGLHSCKHYMQQMNGSIWAESEGKSKGATFILELPSTSQSKQNTEEAATESQQKPRQVDYQQDGHM